MGPEFLVEFEEIMRAIESDEQLNEPDQRLVVYDNYINTTVQQELYIATRASNTGPFDAEGHEY